MNRTVQRKAILNELKRHNDHPTADMLYMNLRVKLPQISLATVYRNLEILSQTGTIRKLPFIGNQKRFEANLTRHYHIRCPHCDSIKDFFAKSISDIDKQFLEVLSDINCDGYYFELSAICDDCQAKIALEREEAKRIADERKKSILTWN